MGKKARENDKAFVIGVQERFRHQFFFLKLGLLAVIFWFIGQHIAENWRAIGKIPPIKISSMLTASVLAFSAYTLTTLGYRMILRYQGYRIHFHRAVGLAFIPMLTKYVPGKVWAVLSAVHLLDREGIHKTVGMATFLLATMLGLMAGLTTTALFGSSLIKDQISWWVYPFTFITLLALTYPPVFYRLSNAGLRLIKRSPLAQRISWSEVLRVLAVFCISRTVIGLGFVFLTDSLYDTGFKTIPTLISIFICANISGFLAFFAPGGIGVREAVLLAGLSPIVGTGPAIIITGITRVWQTVLELVMTGLGALALSRPPLPPRHEDSV